MKQGTSSRTKSLSQSRNYPSFVKPEFSIPSSQQPTNSKPLCNISKHARFHGDEYLFNPPAELPSWGTSFCRLIATAYSIHSQITSVSGGRLLHPQLFTSEHGFIFTTADKHWNTALYELQTTDTHNSHIDPGRQADNVCPLLHFSIPSGYDGRSII
jgi:hypothetical protein